MNWTHILETTDISPDRFADVSNYLDNLTHRLSTISLTGTATYDDSDGEIMAMNIKALSKIKVPYTFVDDPTNTDTSSMKCSNINWSIPCVNVVKMQLLQMLIDKINESDSVIIYSLVQSFDIEGGTMSFTSRIKLL